MNSQNTAWGQHAFVCKHLFTLIPRSFGDILRGYVGQQLLWQDSECVDVHTARVFHRRNKHDLMKDSADEIMAYLSRGTVDTALSRLDGAGPQGERLVSAYASQTAAGVVGKSELQAVEPWQAALDVKACRDKELEILYPLWSQAGKTQK